MNKIKIYVLLACLWAVSALQAQNFGSEAMRKLQMAEFAISHFYVDKVDEDKLVEEAIIKMLAQPKKIFPIRLKLSSTCFCLYLICSE